MSVLYNVFEQSRIVGTKVCLVNKLQCWGYLKGLFDNGIWQVPGHEQLLVKRITKMSICINSSEDKVCVH